MNEYRVRKARPIAAEMRVPGDYAISQRALVVAALANGPSILTGFLPADECLDTLQALRALGVKFDYLSDDDSDLPWVSDGRTGPAGPSRLRVLGTGGQFRAPTAAVNCARSAPALLLLSGLLAGQPFVTRLTGSAGISLAHLTATFQEMGAPLKTTGQGKTAPLSVEGSASLRGIVNKPAIPCPLSRDGLLLAGLFAQGKTSVTDAFAAPDHLERILRHYQIKTLRAGLNVSTWGGQTPESRDFHIPGDISYAAAFITAAATQPGSTLTIRDVGLNAARTAFLRVLVRMGAQVMEEINDTRDGEPRGTVMVHGAPLRGTVINDTETDILTDELPILTVAAALATGGTFIHQTPATAGRLHHMAHNLHLMGVEVARLNKGLEIKGTGGAFLQPGCLPSSGDPHIAMASAVAGLFAEGETIIEDVACVESRWFGFGADLQRFQSREISEGNFTPMIHAVPKTKNPKPLRSGKKTP